MRKQLAESGGGPLGVEAVKEVVIGVTDLERGRRSLAEAVGSDAVIRLELVAGGQGARNTPCQAEENTVRGLVVSVASLPRAKAFLREKGLLG